MNVGVMKSEKPKSGRSEVVVGKQGGSELESDGAEHLDSSAGCDGILAAVVEFKESASSLSGSVDWPD